MSTAARKRRARYQDAGKRAPRWKSRLLDTGILLATAVVCIFLFSISTRFGYSRSENQEPPIVLRAQVLNACGRPGLASRTADQTFDQRESIIFRHISGWNIMAFWLATLSLR